MFVTEKEKNYFKYEKKVTLSLVSRNEVVFQSLTERISGIRSRNHSILSVTCYPIVCHSPRKHIGNN